MRDNGPLEWTKRDHRGFASVRDRLDIINDRCRALLRVMDLQPSEVLTWRRLARRSSGFINLGRAGLFPTISTQNAPTRPRRQVSTVWIASIHCKTSSTWFGDEFAKLQNAVCIVDDVNPIWSELISHSNYQDMPRAFGVGEEVFDLVARRVDVTARSHDLDTGNALCHGAAAVCSAPPHFADQVSTGAAVQRPPPPP